MLNAIRNSRSVPERMHFDGQTSPAEGGPVSVAVLAAVGRLKALLSCSSTDFNAQPSSLKLSDTLRTQRNRPSVSAGPVV